MSCFCFACPSVSLTSFSLAVVVIEWPKMVCAQCQWFIIVVIYCHSNITTFQFKFPQYQNDRQITMRTQRYEVIWSPFSIQKCHHFGSSHFLFESKWGNSPFGIDERDENAFNFCFVNRSTPNETFYFKWYHVVIWKQFIFVFSINIQA